MIPVARTQLEGLATALQLLREARAEVPWDVYIMAKIRKDRFPDVRLAFLDEIERVFRNAAGMSPTEAADATDVSDVVEVAVRIPLSDETLHSFLTTGLTVNKDDGIIRFIHRKQPWTLHVMVPRGLQLRVSFEDARQLMLANGEESLDLYLSRAALIDP